MKKIIIYFIALIVFSGGFLGGFIPAQKAKAVDPSSFDSSKFSEDFIPELAGVAIDELNKSIPTLSHNFKYGGNEYTTIYNEAFYFDGANDPHLWAAHCWKLAQSDFSTPDSKYLYCAVGGQGSSYNSIYTKVSKTEYDQEYSKGSTYYLEFINYNSEYYLSINLSKVIFDKYTQNQKLAEYLWSMIDRDAHDFWKEGSQKKDCEKMFTTPGKYTAEQYGGCFFPSGGNFPLTIDMSSGAPTISVAGSGNRPAITFKLTQVMRSFGVGGIGGRTNDYFYFIATNPSYPNLSIRLTDCSIPAGSPVGDARFMDPHLIENLNDDTDINGNISGVGRPDIAIDDAVYKTFMEKVYGSGALDTTLTNNGCPSASFNASQMNSWGVSIITRNDNVGASGGGDKCGNANSVSGAILVGFCSLTVAVREWAMSILCYAQDKLTEVLGQQSMTSGACDTNSVYKKDPTMNQLIN